MSFSLCLISLFSFMIAYNTYTNTSYLSLNSRTHLEWKQRTQQEKAHLRGQVELMRVGRGHN